jgi:hypothetical protein
MTESVGSRWCFDRTCAVTENLVSNVKAECGPRRAPGRLNLLTHHARNTAPRLLAAWPRKIVMDMTARLRKLL